MERKAESTERIGSEVRGAQRVVEPLRYLSPGGEEPAERKESAEPGAGPEGDWRARLAASDAEWKARMEAVRQEALAEGRAQVEEDRMELLRHLGGQLGHAVKEFAHARESYFARVEREVVELALAIAARILQREVQVDALLLAGAVRVALGQLQESTQVELHVPSSTHGMWSETLRLMPSLPVMPVVVADSEMKDGECVLTTAVGRVDLGIKAQLKEIERGFFDLLSHRDTARERDSVGAEL
jgi:flagellar assembly protein FliH